MRPAKRPNAAAKLEELGIDGDDWDALRADYKAYDESREVVIKKCRDVQKLAKQAVFALVRGDAARADQQLAGAEAAAREVLPLVEETPALRSGAFSNAMEEYAEAQVLRGYLSTGRVPRRGDSPLHLTADEYLGGLLDWSGELNRVAVARATQRDKAAVQACHDAVAEVQVALLDLDLRQPALRKKLGPLAATEAKLSHMLYELSLAEGTLLASTGGLTGGGEAGGGGGGGEGGGGGGRAPGDEDGG